MDNYPIVRMSPSDVMLAVTATLHILLEEMHIHFLKILKNFIVPLISFQKIRDEESLALLVKFLSIGCLTVSQRLSEECFMVLNFSLNLKYNLK